MINSELLDSISNRLGISFITIKEEEKRDGNKYFISRILNCCVYEEGQIGGLLIFIREYENLIPPVDFRFHITDGKLFSEHTDEIEKSIYIHPALTELIQVTFSNLKEA